MDIVLFSHLNPPGADQFLLQKKTPELLRGGKPRSLPDHPQPFYEHGDAEIQKGYSPVFLVPVSENTYSGLSSRKLLMTLHESPDETWINQDRKSEVPLVYIGKQEYFSWLIFADLIRLLQKSHTQSPLKTSPLLSSLKCSKKFYYN